MDKKIIYRVFKGRASGKEIAIVRQWVESNPGNREEYMRERALFDAIQLSDFASTYTTGSKSIFRYTQTWLKIAAVVAILLSGSLYFLTGNKQEELVAMNTITVPAGQRVNIVLSDGTEVWLNSRSKFTYPTSFSKKQREVYLSGEAFFDVTKNDKKKFIVHANTCKVEVLGTRFNVESYEATGEFSTSLLRGSVRITNSAHPSQSVILKPNNIASVKGGKLEVKPITDYDHYRWTEGLICFKDAGFKQLMKRLEKSFDVRIIIENKNLKNYACSGKFRISDGIDALLRILQKDTNFLVEKDENTNIIYIK